MADPRDIRRVAAKGDAFAIGQAMGRAAAADIRERSFVTTEFKALKARWLGSDYLGRLEAAARNHYPAFVREIEGIADGAGLDFPSVFMWNCRGDLRLPEDASAAERARAAEGCTTIMIPPAGDAPAVIAHNEDGAPELLGHCFWVEAEPDDGPAFQSFMYPGMLPGHTLGLNAAGIVQTINNIRVHDLKPGIPRHVVCRAVLAASTMEDALAVLTRPDRASGFHHNLGSAREGRLCSVEAPASGCRVREIAAPSAHANHLIEPEFAGLAQEVTGSSRDRQQSADALVSAQPPKSAADAEGILFERETPIYRANDAGDDYSQTLCTGVFELHRDRVDWRLHASPANRSALAGSLGVHQGA
ncbi:MAG: C45 family peptidase [Rhodospirillaceae bacterium]